jgi:hypothetical protein
VKTTFFMRFKHILALIFFSSIPLLSFAHGISEADKQRMLDGGYLQYVRLGATHMLSGYDHLLFLLGVVFLLVSFKEIAKFVTVFTLGHCITLVFATFFQLSFNYFLIEAAIALSVVYKGFDNIGGFQKHFGMKSPSILAAVFLFGLIHGFGLSTRLQELPLGDDTLSILGRILSFNVEVELAQIAALGVMITLLKTWRKRSSFDAFSKVSNHALLFLGFILFIKQLHGYWHDSHPNNFKFPAAEHRHAHEEMAAEKLKD